MKKWFAFVILILSSFVCVACGKTPTISYEKTEIQLNFDETYTIIEEDIVIKNSKNDYIVSILDTNIAELDGLTIKPKTKGKTFIRFAIENEDIYIDIPLIITHIIYATTAEIESQSIVININLEDEAFNRITLNDNCNEQPQISYDRNVISYDYITGRIVPVNVGTTNVIVMFNACNVSFTVTVIDVVYTSAVEVEEHLIYLGNSGTFDFKVYPKLANTYRFYCFSDKLVVSESGEYSTLKSGLVDVFVEYYVSENTPVVKTFKVNIIQEIESFDFSIINDNDSEARYYLKEKKYKIVINNVSNVGEQDVRVSDNFDIESIIVEDNSIVISGVFKSTGLQTISVDIDSNNKVVSKANNFDVYEISDVEIVAKWSAYNQQPYDDGKYHIKLEETPNYPSYLKFGLSVNDTNITDSFVVYDITADKVETSLTFNPSSKGEFVFQLEFLGVVVGNIIVVVE